MCGMGDIDFLEQQQLFRQRILCSTFIVFSTLPFLWEKERGTEEGKEGRKKEEEGKKEGGRKGGREEREREEREREEGEKE